MNTTELIAHINEFFGDLSRTEEQTRAGLEEAISHAQVFVDSLSESDEGCD